MSDRLHDKARSLSGGQIRRVEIIRALLHKPSLLLLDEATVGLDIKSRATIPSDIRKLVKEDVISVLWATHLIDEVRETDPVIVLHKGRVLADDRASEIARRTGQENLLSAFETLIGEPAAPKEVAV